MGVGPLTISKQERKEILVFPLDGIFDITETGKFEKYILENLKNYKDIALEFKGITFIDSSAIGSMIKILGMIKQKGGKLYVFGLTEHIDNVFKTAKLGLFLNVMTEKDFDKQFPKKGTDIDDILNRL